MKTVQIQVEPIPPLLSVKEARSLLGGIATSALYVLIDKGEIERVKLGRRALITGQSIVDLIERMQNEARNKQAVWA